MREGWKQPEMFCKRGERAVKIGTAIGTAQIVGTEFSNYVNQIHMKI